MSNPLQKYKQTQIVSASREKLLLMMYEGAIKFTKRAIVAAEQKNVAERCTAIGRAYDIVTELNNTLDHKVGGDIAKNLEQLYMFITDQLTKANLNGTVEPLQHSLKILETLYEGWVQAVDQVKRQEAANNSGAKEG
jgi:flagellar protein FliS